MGAILGMNVPLPEVLLVPLLHGITQHGLGLAPDIGETPAPQVQLPGDGRGGLHQLSEARLRLLDVGGIPGDPADGIDLAIFVPHGKARGGKGAQLSSPHRDGIVGLQGMPHAQHVLVRTADLLGDGGGKQLRVGTPHHFLAIDAKDLLATAVDEQVAPFQVLDPDQRRRVVHDGLEVATVLRRFHAQAVLFRDVVEDQHHAEDLPATANGRRGVADLVLSAVPRDEGGVVAEVYGLAGGQHLVHGVLDGLARGRIDDGKDIPERQAPGIVDGPAGEILRHRVHARHPACRVGDDDGVTDTVQGLRQVVGLAVQFVDVVV